MSARLETPCRRLSDSPSRPCNGYSSGWRAVVSQDHAFLLVHSRDLGGRSTKRLPAGVRNAIRRAVLAAVWLERLLEPSPPLPSAAQRACPGHEPVTGGVRQCLLQLIGGALVVTDRCCRRYDAARCARSSWTRTSVGAARSSLRLVERRRPHTRDQRIGEHSFRPSGEPGRADGLGPGGAQASTTGSPRREVSSRAAAARNS